MKSIPKRPIAIDDLFNIKLLSDMQLSPDGKTIAFVQTVFDLDNDKYHAHLWLMPANGSTPPRQLTFGKGKDRLPCWSPDGQSLAFISDREEEKKEKIYVIAVTSGESVALTDMLKSPNALQWSPNGTHLVFSAKVEAPDSKKENGAREGSDVRSYTRLNYKADGEGLWDYSWTHIFTLTLKGLKGEVKQLTRGPYNHVEPSWSPDSKTIVFAANRTARADETRVTDIWSLPARGGALKQLTHNKGPSHLPTYSPDGKWIAYVGHENEFQFVTLSTVYCMPARGGRAKKITENFDRSYGNAVINDLRNAPGDAWPAPLWSHDSKTLYFLTTEGGTSQLVSAPAKGGAVKTLTKGQHQIYELSYSPATHQFALAISDPVNPNDIFMSSPRGTLKRLTHVNEALTKNLLISKPERFSARHEGVTIEGWMLKPVSWKSGKKYPALLEIHGGPHCTFGAVFFHEMQLLCAQGYAVIYTNPRGSIGYGQEFAKAVCGDWGFVDYHDLMKATDVALKKYSWIDPKNLGVLGGSYGGFMTSWIVSHTDRFKVGISERALNNWYSFNGTSDIGPYFGPALEIGEETWENPTKYLKHSAIAYVHHCKTPLLIIHSENDLRCPMEQAEQMYVALKKLRVPVEFVRFPEEPHGLSRMGKPKHRKERLERIVQWLNKWLNK